MLARYYKGEPNTYILCHRNGALLRHGAGINFFYLPATTTISAVPLVSRESRFIFNEATADYQEVAIQGSFTYRLADPREIAKRLDFTISPKKREYQSDDPEQLVQRVVNAVQAHTRSEVNRRPLEEALTEVRDLAAVVFDNVSTAAELTDLGIVLSHGLRRLAPPY